MARHGRMCCAFYKNEPKFIFPEIKATKKNNIVPFSSFSNEIGIPIV